MNPDYTQREEYLPPHNLEAEKSVLGALLTDPDAILDVADFLRPEAFYYTDHSRIFAAMMELWQKNEPIDVIGVSEVIRSRGWEEDVTGTKNSTVSHVVADHLYGFIGNTFTSIHAKRDGRIVHETYQRRQLIRAAQQIATMAYTEHGDVTEIIGRSESMILSLGQQNGKHVKQIGDIALEYFESLQNSPQGDVGIPTGYVDLDRLLTLRRGEFTLVAARPGMGKTALLQKIAVNAGKKHNKRVFISALEMAGPQIIERHMSPVLRIESGELRKGNLDERGWQLLGEEVGRLSQTHIYLDDDRYLTTSKLRAKCLRLQAEHGLDLVVVDYLQLMQSERRTQNRNVEIGEISRALKLLAGELSVPVLVASQLSRAVEQRQNKRPMLSDLRDSGSLEQDADNVLFIYRDEYYNADTTDRLGIAEVNVAKQRMGPVGTIDLYWNGRFASFSNLQRAEIKL
jgi:replicative DNA helicase